MHRVLVLSVLIGLTPVRPALAAPSRPAPLPAAVLRAARDLRPEGLEAHVRFLADDLLEGRGTGTRGYELAARYVESRLRALGLAPGGDHGDSYPLFGVGGGQALADEIGVELLGQVPIEPTVVSADVSASQIACTPAADNE